MTQTRPLYKTTIVIWTDYFPLSREIDDLAREAMVGDAYCSKQEISKIENPEDDCDWDDTEFFGVNDE